MTDAVKLETTQNLLAGMYAEFKNRGFENPMNDDELDEELRRLEATDILTLISYLDSLFEIMASMKVDASEKLVQDRVSKIVKQ